MHYRTGLVSFESLLSRVVETVKPRATEDLIRFLEIDDIALAKEKNFSELERNFRFHKQFAEQYYGKNSPGVARFLLRRAICAKNAGNDQKARELFDSCMSILNNFTQHDAEIYTEVLSDLEGWYYQNKDMVNAEKIANQLIAVDMDRSDIKANAYMQLAEIYFDEKKYAEAAEAAIKARDIAVKRNAEDFTFIENSSRLAGTALLELKHSDEAIKQIQLALSLIKPSSTDSIAARERLLKTLSTIHGDTGNWKYQ